MRDLGRLLYAFGPVVVLDHLLAGGRGGDRRGHAGACRADSCDVVRARRRGEGGDAGGGRGCAGGEGGAEFDGGLVTVGGIGGAECA